MHESPLLAEQGVKQYYCPINVQDSWEKEKKESVAVTTESSLEAHQVEDLKTMMENSYSFTVPQVSSKKRKTTGSSGSGQKPAPPPADAKEEEPLTPEQKKAIEDEKL
eukprot:9474918-Pyramimonas_sp.AAC.1